MRVYLVRHGEAQPAEIDPQRRLTPRGEAEVKAMAAFLKPLALTVARLWHSGKPRAAQTAAILEKAVTLTGPAEPRGGMGPNDDPQPMRDELERLDQDLMIVGHMPFHSRLASALLTGDDQADFLGFATAAVACLRRDADGPWRLLWLVAPHTLK